MLLEVASPVWLLTIGAVVVVFVSVLLVVSCIDCGKKVDYTPLDRDFLEAKDTEAKERKQLQKQRSEGWLDAQYYIKSIPKCKLEDYDLFEMGYRKERTNFLLKFENKPTLFSMVPPGEGCVFTLKTESGRSVFKSILTSLDHPYIHLISRTDFWIPQGKAVVFSHFSDEGSLRDLLFKSKPTARFSDKYEAIRQSPPPLSKHKIADFGRQILEALLYLKECGVPYTHLHSGNVIIKYDTARITNLENGLLNLERQNERLLRQFNKKARAKLEKMDLEVVTFGMLLFEMSTGANLKNLSQLEAYPPNTLKEAIEIMDSIFKDADKFPTLDDLAKHSLFASVKLKISAKPVELDDRAKKLLKLAEQQVRQIKGTVSTSPSKAKPVKYKSAPKTTTTSTSTANTPSSLSQSNNANRPVQSPAPSNPAPTTSSTSQTSVSSSAKSPAPAAPPAPAPPPPAPGPPPPPPPSIAPSLPSPQEGRDDLLGSIRSFSNRNLKKTVTNDRSAPVV